MMKKELGQDLTTFKGNLRKEDLFLTDARLEPIKDYQPMYSYDDSDIDKADIDEALEDMERIK